MRACASSRWRGAEVQTSTAQTIRLVLAANARLRGLSLASGWPDGPDWMFCRAVRFTGRKGTGSVSDPEQWLDTMPKGATHAQLQVLTRESEHPSRKLVGFANQDPAFLAQLPGPTPESWIGGWQPTRQGAADRRIWTVEYRNVPEVSTDLPPLSRDDVRTRLATVLGDARDFSRSNDLPQFDACFELALDALDAAEPTITAGDDGFPEGLLPLDAHQLLAAVDRAWVFGGMGSWNDLGFEPSAQATYDELSERLFWTLVEALVVGANASGLIPPGG
jgi:hypothetical protein